MTGLAASLLVGLSLVFVSHDVTAQQVHLDVEMTVAAQRALQPRERRTTLTAKMDADSVLRVFDDSNRVLVTIRPVAHPDGTVLLAMKIFEVATGTEFLKFDVEHSVPLSMPKILVADRETGEIALGDDERHINIKVTPSLLY